MAADWQIPQVKDSIPQDFTCLPPPTSTISDASCRSRLLPVFLTGDKSKVPKPLSSSSINLLEQLTELRETSYLLGYQYIIKGYNSGISRQRRCIRQAMGKGHGDSMLSVSLSHHVHVLAYPEAL